MVFYFKIIFYLQFPPIFLVGLVHDSVSEGRMVQPVKENQTETFKFNVDCLYWKEGVMRDFTWKRYIISDSHKLVIIRKKSTVSFSFILLYSCLNEHFTSSACSIRAIIFI